MTRNPAATASSAHSGAPASIGFGEKPEIKLVSVRSLKPADWNPRLIRDQRFQQLCRSLESDPEFLWRRPVIANAAGVVMAGNMRLRAAQHLGWPEVPAILDDVPDQVAKERALRDNNGWGEWQEQELSELLAELQLGGSELETLGFEPWRLNQLIGDGIDDPAAEWQGMPAFEHEDKTAYKSIAVHFKDQEAVAAFAVLVGQKITEQTRYLWYPEIEIERYMDKRYAPES